MYASSAALVGFNGAMRTSMSSIRELLTQLPPAQRILVGNFAIISQIVWYVSKL